MVIGLSVKICGVMGWCRLNMMCMMVGVFWLMCMLEM